MVAGAVLLVLGFIGFVCSLNRDAEVNQGPTERRREAHRREAGKGMTRSKSSKKARN